MKASKDFPMRNREHKQERFDAEAFLASELLREFKPKASKPVYHNLAGERIESGQFHKRTQSLRMICEAQGIVIKPKC